MLLRANNTDLLVSNYVKTYLTSKQSSASGTITVESITGFGVGQQIIIGSIGDERTEQIRVHASTAPSGTTITLNANTAHGHEAGTPVYLVDYDQVEFSRATTVSGSKSVLATSSLTPDSMDTIYNDTTNTTGFGFWRFKNSATTKYSSYSGAIPYAGYEPNTAATIFERALSSAGAKVTPLLTYDRLFGFLNDFIMLANSRNKRWSECKVLDEELDTVATGDWEYALPTEIAHKTDPTSIISLRIRDNLPLVYMPQREWNKAVMSTIYSTISAAITLGDATISVTNSAQFGDTGTVMINGTNYTYTDNTSNTLTLDAVATVAQADASYIFQSESTGTPMIYTIPSSGYVRIYPIAGSSVNNHVIYISYYKRIPEVDDLTDSILITDPKAAIDYVAYRIKKHLAGGNLSLNDEEYMQFMQDFQAMIDHNNPAEPLRVTV